LSKIRQFHIERKAALPEAVRSVNSTQDPLVLIDPAIQQLRLSIIAKTNDELKAKPGAITSGDLKMQGLQTTQQLSFKG
jgi:hypothetical protein